MTLNTDAFWGSLEPDGIRCYMPTILGPLDDVNEWDGFFDFNESIHPNSSFEPLREQLQYPREPPNEWLESFKGAQDGRDQASSVGFSIAPIPQGHEQDFHTTSDINSMQCGLDEPSFVHHQYYPDEGSSRDEAPACARDKDECVTPTPTRQSCSDDRSRAEPQDWAPTQYKDNQNSLGGRDLQCTVESLKELEQNLRADTKRRISQVEKSLPG
ncbi:hypothetical protein F4808DRAFT_412135 [Astrocystis sublimbata]|nr:hypothetical protein F4808DRAFT_412135 [Astrocystis sublimbata]